MNLFHLKYSFCLPLDFTAQGDRTTRPSGYGLRSSEVKNSNAAGNLTTTPGIE